MIIDEEAYLAHYGILRKSGRYPWGSGEDQSTRNKTFLDITNQMRKDGMTDTQIAEGFGMTTTDLRALRSIAGSQQKRDNIFRAQQLKDKGLSNMAIGREMGINESSVRSLLEPGAKERADNLETIANMLKRQVEEKTYVDIGEGVENHIGIAQTKLKTAVAMLKEEGYVDHKIQVDQLGTKNKTTIKVLAPPGTTYRDVVANRDKIQQITEFSEDGGRTMLGLKPPLNIDSKRIAVKYKEEGGDQADGVIFVRPGVPDVSIGKNAYAQVRIAVDGTHYLKGMAVYKDDLPPGVDLMFNTNKSNTGNKLDAMKPMKDEENPFGSIVRQMVVRDADGTERVTSAMNMVGSKEGSGAEGAWGEWSNSLASQVLSKQSPKLINQQLDVAYKRSQEELDSIRSLTNPTVRRYLLEKYADGADSASVHLKAAAIPRQATQVILPVNSLKDNEVYAPNFKNGERVALVRFPHGGTFEIPELTVNNRNPEGQKLLGKQAKDAVGINHKVAQRLSGADFDGDFVLVIPNNNDAIKSTPALQGLKNFDPQMYKLPDSVPRMKSKTKQTEMGKVSNLITDMTIKGASPDELARAVRHSMVVIDAEKHHLDYKKSAQANGIKALEAKYQAKPNGKAGGSSTIISRAKGEVRVADRKLRSPKDGGPIDPVTGRKVYRDQPESFVNRNGQVVIKTRASTKLAETDDAFTLVGDRSDPVESAYANHSNRMKQLANDARRDVAAFKPPLYNKSAKEAYSSEVQSLNAKLDAARRNKPLERQAQVFANATVAQMRAEKPDMDGAELKKIKAQALAAARARTKASKQLIRPTPQEWAAIQAGAISNNQLRQILDNADIDTIRTLATPRTPKLMDSGKVARAQSMMASGYTQAEVAEALGVSLTTLKNELNA